MHKIKIQQGEWVVVCDGAKALIFENAGDEKFPNLKTREVFEHDDAATRDQGTDKPGRSFSSVDSRRSGMEQTDWHNQSETRFLETLASHLSEAVEKGSVKTIVLVAPPRALGVLRHACSHSHGLREAIRTEIDKDYVRLPVYEIEKHLVG